MSVLRRPPSVAISRRRLCAGATALMAWRSLPLQAASPELPDIPELSALLAGRAPRVARLQLDVPRIADDGNAVPVRLAVPGPFAAGMHVRTLALFAERNPVRTVVVVDFPQPVGRAEFETRIRLAGTQRVVAIAALANDEVLAATTEVVVAASACLDGT